MFESLYQTFTESADPTQGKPRLAALRAELDKRGLDGFIVPRTDAYQNEYVPASDERLAWLTGFTGSAGLAVVLKDRAAIFVDGRYTLQVQDQVDTRQFTPQPIAEITPAQWLAKTVGKGMKIGCDPWLTTSQTFDGYERALRAADAELVAVDDNPLDAVWYDRPPAPLGAIRLHPKKFTGVDAKQKLKRIASALDTGEALLVTNPHNVAWAFNIRGSDVGHTPLPLSRAIISKDGAHLFVDGRKLDPKTRASLEKLAQIEEPEQLRQTLSRFGRDGASVRFDSGSAPAALITALKSAGGRPVIGDDPITLMKALKSTAEIEGARAAHLRDAAAVASFLAWFDETAPKGRLSEIDAVEALETFRRQTGQLKDVSFPTISGAGPNGAIVHYRVTDKTNRRIGRGLFLLDSGAQYEDGTTDITRTISVGTPTKEMRVCYTRVLKGHIAIATAVFPKGTSGAQIDAFARHALWQAGLDFDHGTGHGVGSFLSVHEGPQNISKRGFTTLEPGMILSNEPGYYRTGAFGIRIENLVLVEERAITGAERDMYGFETLTLVPIDTRAIDKNLMTQDEVRWLDAYHQRVRKALSPLVSPATRKWLVKATKPLGRG
ncbi:MULTISPECIES: aminopeptidase P family protein [unclassified Beijerinckia]|uniref:aminopeptidase P family protein n=1 Tax=unclassified Beijerinckia TaxID=2638183 RepID=UPI000B8A54A9|nr:MULTISPECIES: aminopeptidase P family protein [unclassified Beijerinckia]